MSVACKNTDRELWRGPDEGCGDYYADSIHVTEQGAIGIDCGGLVFVKTLRAWHALAVAACDHRWSDPSINAPHPCHCTLCGTPKVRYANASAPADSCAAASPKDSKAE